MTGADWWRHAVVYQIYPRSFADAHGDGVGDRTLQASTFPSCVALDMHGSDDAIAY